MLSVKVPLKQAETVKKLLVSQHNFDYNHLPAKRGNYIFLPIKKRSNGLKFSYSKKNLEESKPRTYHEILKHIPFNVRNNLPTSFDVIGTLIIIDFPKSLQKYETQIAEAMLKKHGNVKSVFKKTGIHTGEYRIQQLEHVCGNNNTEVMYIEHNVKLKFDAAKVYFSPRLSSERKRIYQQVKPGENILVMFSGCGPYPLVIAKNSNARHITGIEKNPVAHQYAQENLTINKIKNVTFLKGDVKDLVSNLGNFDRIIMPLPKHAGLFLDYAVKVSKKGTIIHFYDFQRESEISKSGELVTKYFASHSIPCLIQGIHKCGQYAPGKIRVCVDILI